MGGQPGVIKSGDGHLPRHRNVLSRRLEDGAVSKRFGTAQDCRWWVVLAHDQAQHLTPLLHPERPFDQILVSQFVAMLCIAFAHAGQAILGAVVMLKNTREHGDTFMPQAEQIVGQMFSGRAIVEPHRRMGLLIC